MKSTSMFFWPEIPVGSHPVFSCTTYFKPEHPVRELLVCLMVALGIIRIRMAAVIELRDMESAAVDIETDVPLLNHLNHRLQQIWTSQTGVQFPAFCPQKDKYPFGSALVPYRIHPKTDYRTVGSEAPNSPPDAASPE